MGSANPRAHVPVSPRRRGRASATTRRRTRVRRLENRTRRKPPRTNRFRSRDPRLFPGSTNATTETSTNGSYRCTPRLEGRTARPPPSAYAPTRRRGGSSPRRTAPRRGGSARSATRTARGGRSPRVLESLESPEASAARGPGKERVRLVPRRGRPRLTDLRFRARRARRRRTATRRMRAIRVRREIRVRTGSTSAPICATRGSNTRVEAHERDATRGWTAFGAARLAEEERGARRRAASVSNPGKPSPRGRLAFLATRWGRASPAAPPAASPAAPRLPRCHP